MTASAACSSVCTTFFESVGFLWPCPGTEVIPAGYVGPEPSSGKDAPSLSGRCLIIGSTAFLPRLDAWIEWCARNRLNTVFFHLGSPGVERTGASIPFPQWDEVSDQALSTAAKFGLTIELGGHWLPSFLSRDRFAESPDAFRMVDGERRADSNFCTSSPITIAAIEAGAPRCSRSTRRSTCSTCWADDAGNWCACPECADVSASDQLLRATNAVAAVLRDVNPSAQIAYLSYLETDAPPVGRARAERVPPVGASQALLRPRPRRRVVRHQRAQVPRRLRRVLPRVRGHRRATNARLRVLARRDPVQELLPSVRVGRPRHRDVPRRRCAHGAGAAGWAARRARRVARVLALRPSRLGSARRRRRASCAIRRRGARRSRPRSRPARPRPRLVPRVATGTRRPAVRASGRPWKR